MNKWGVKWAIKWSVKISKKDVRNNHKIIFENNVFLNE